MTEIEELRLAVADALVVTERGSNDPLKKVLRLAVNTSDPIILRDALSMFRDGCVPRCCR